MATTEVVPETVIQALTGSKPEKRPLRGRQHCLPIVEDAQSVSEFAPMQTPTQPNQGAGSSASAYPSFPPGYGTPMQAFPTAFSNPTTYGMQQGPYLPFQMPGMGPLYPQFASSPLVPYPIPSTPSRVRSNKRRYDDIQSSPYEPAEPLLSHLVYPAIYDWLCDIEEDVRRNPDEHKYTPLIEALKQGGIDRLNDLTRLQLAEVQQITALNVATARRIMEWAAEDKKRFERLHLRKAPRSY